MNTHRSLGPIVASILILAGLIPFAPGAAAADCDSTNNIPQDVSGGDHAWIRASQPAADDASVSELVRLQLDAFLADDVAELGNGIDAYVHDLGCEIAVERDWCIADLNADRSSTGVPVLGSSQQVIALNDRDDDWKISFFTDGPVHNELASVTVDTKNRDGCDPTDTLEGNDDPVPVTTRYVVIWLDSSEMVNDDPDDLDHTHNLVPRGYQFRDDQTAPRYSTYNVHFEFDVCGPNEC